MPPFKVALVTRNLSEIPDWVAEKIVSAGIDLVVYQCSNSRELLETAGDAQVIWTMGANKVVDEQILPSLDKCRALMRSGSGLDDLPVQAARKQGIKVVNTPEAIAETVAEHTVAMLFALTRQIPRHDRAVKNGNWESSPVWAKWHIPQQTMGLIGFGLIAQYTVAMLQGMRMNFVACDPYVGKSLMQRHQVAAADLNEVLEKADFVSVHCPLTAETHHLLGEKEIRKMKSNAFLINTSRGAVVDEKALITALREGRIAGAALDVLTDEPPAADNPLLNMDNVIITPHIAAFSDQFEEKFWMAAIMKLQQLKKELK